MRNEAFLYELSKKKDEKIPTPDVVIDAESREDIANTFIPKLNDKGDIDPDLKNEIEKRKEKVIAEKEKASLEAIKRNIQSMMAEADKKSTGARNARILKGEFDKPYERTADELRTVQNPYEFEPEQK